MGSAQLVNYGQNLVPWGRGGGALKPRPNESHRL